jgi:hypothetical protein
MKTFIRFAGIVSAIVLSAAFFATPASAQATRTWISGVGDDTNPCSRTEPCKTFAGAIPMTAAGGEIDCLDPGGFGAVTVTKSITLDCAGGIGGEVGSILASGTNGITINTAGAFVKIRNMSINCGGLPGNTFTCLSGIKFINGAGLIVEHVGIFGSGQASSTGTYAAVDFEPSTAAKLNMLDVECQYGQADGVLIKPQSGGSATATLDRVSCMQNAGAGLRVDSSNWTSGPGSNVTVFGSNMSGNAVGVEAFSPSGTKTATIEVTASVVSQNSGVGLLGDGTHATIIVGGSTIMGNATGLSATAHSTINTFQDNYFSNGAAGTSNGTPTGNVAKL